jgi:hypothetical protein
MFEHFYHGSIRKLVVSFGSLFDEIYVSRKNADGTEEKKIKVPISYAPKEKFYRKIVELNQSGDRKSVESIVPRMAFEITSMVYDPSRKLNSLNKIYTTKDEKDKTFSYSYNEVPYTVEFNLNVMTRNIDDGYQIVEQILPYFTPDFTVSLNFNELYKKIDVPIVLNSVSSSEEYEGSLADERRMITHTLSFSAKSYVLGPIKQGGLIREIRLTFNELTGDS